MLVQNKTNCVVYRDNAGQIHEFANTLVGFIGHIKYLIDQTAFTDRWDTDKINRFNRDYNRYCDRHGVVPITPAPQDYIYGAFAQQAVEKIKYILGTKFDDLLIKAKDYLVEKATKVNDLEPSSMSFYLRRTDNVFDCYDCENITPINMVRGYSGERRYAFYRDEVFKLGVYYISKALKNELKVCEDCGAKYFDQDNFSRSERSNLPEALIGRDYYCRDCVTNHGYSICEDCGEIVDENCTYWIENEERLICEHCYETGNYTQCEHCGEYFCTDDDYAVCTDDGYWFCCESCADREGYAWDEDNECWTDSDNIERERLIADYHSTYFAFVGSMPKNAKGKLGSGEEIEVVGDDLYEHEEFWRDRIIGHYLQNGLYGTVEHDGTVTAEIVMQPMTEREYNKFPFEEMFKELVEHGYTGHNNNSAGHHVHYSRGYLGYNNNQIMNNAKKVCRFFEDHWDDLVKFSRRKDEQLRWCNKHNMVITQKTPYENLACDRYYAVNLTNMFSNKRGTIEIRIPRGTLNPKTSRATVDFFRHIIRNAKHISWKNINNLKLWFKGIKDQNTIDYIKSRNAFVGEF